MKLKLNQEDCNNTNGFSCIIPKNFEIQIRPRSGLAAKNQISVLNTPGTIDADYRGELKVILINLSDKIFKIEKGLRIAQMVLCPVIKATLKEVDTLEITDVVLVGLVQQAPNKKMKFNLKDFKRFEKQIILKKIGIYGQKKIKNSKF